MKDEKQIAEFMRLTAEAHKYAALESELLRQTTVKPIAVVTREEPTYEERKRFYEKLNTPYGL
ncbi:MAG TPA: hypothetical protein VFM18_19420 [Methanosarcina sp.]|nr:hypothetical protein [Methanosarcina sp.]